MNALITFEDVLDYILDGATDEEIDRVWDAARTRQKVLRAKAAALVSVGTRVTLVDISPKYMAGLTGEVTQIVGNRASVLIDGKSTMTLRYKGKRRFYIPRDVEEYEVNGIPLSTCRPA